MEQAKQNERRQYLQNEVMEALKGKQEIRDDELMGMRCVVTVEQFPERKVKARLVILGYQTGDLEDALLEAATPTPRRRAKHSFCKWRSGRQTSWELSCQYGSNKRTGTRLQ